MKTRFILKSAILCLLLVSVFVITHNVLAVTSTFTTSETTTNLALGSDDQTAATTTSVANVSEVKASTTLAIGSLPGNATTITVGACVVTFTATAGSTADSTNCTGGTATIDRDVGAGDTPRTATEIAVALQGLTYVKNPVASSSTNIIVSASSTSATSVGFSTAASSTETGGRILFTDGTSGVVTQSNQVTGVAPVAMIETVTIGGTVEENDVFAVKMGSVSASYTVLSTDTTTSNIATGLNTAIQVADGYAGLTYSSTVSTNVISLTAETAGTSFDPATTTLTNRVARKQVVTFTPALVTNGEIFSLNIDSNSYTHQANGSDSVSSVVSALATAASVDPVANCTGDGAKVTCTAKTAGTGFAYGTTVTAPRNSSGGSGSGSSSGRAVIPTPNIPAIITPAGVTPPGIAFIFSGFLSQGSNGASVLALQNRLQQEGFLKATPTGYFGSATLKALKAYQKSHGIDPLGIVGPATRAELNKSTTPPAVSTLTTEARATLIQQISLKIQDLLNQINALKAKQGQ